MSDLGSVMNVAKDALLSHASAINITGSNIANVNTPGYSRLRPVFSSIGGAAELQFGVEVSGAERLYDKYLEVQLVQQNQEIGYYEARKGVLDRVEGIFNESAGGGLNESLTKFWNAWEDLSANPTGTVQRDALVSAAESLATVFRQKAEELQEIRQDMNVSVSGTVSEVNSYLTNIAELNEKIVQTTTGGGNASDLLDKRQDNLQKLGALIDFQYIEDASGAVNVFTSNGKPLVEAGRTWKLGTAVNAGEHDYYDVVFQDNGEVIDYFSKGKLAACLEARDTTVDGYLDKLDSLAASLVKAVNEKHLEGYDMYGNIGGDFFVFDPVTDADAAHMRVSTAITEDPGKIAASTSVDSDGNNASAIAAIKDSLLTVGDDTTTATLSDHYSALMARVGQDVKDSNSSLDHQTVIMSQLESQRETVSGVSLDEEMMNLMKYQLGYNAAGRLAATVSALMDTLMSMMEG
jgi:flagellar hook-associated protein 1 FlgK